VSSSSRGLPGMSPPRFLSSTRHRGRDNYRVASILFSSLFSLLSSLSSLQSHYRRVFGRRLSKKTRPLPRRFHLYTHRSQHHYRRVFCCPPRTATTASLPSLTFQIHISTTNKKIYIYIFTHRLITAAFLVVVLKKTRPLPRRFHLYLFSPFFLLSVCLSVSLSVCPSVYPSVPSVCTVHVRVHVHVQKNSCLVARVARRMNE